MTTKLDEYAINLPMTGVTGVGGTAKSAVPAPAYGYYDITADCSLPAEVSKNCEHIYAYLDSATTTNRDQTNSKLTIDLVLTIAVTNPSTGSTSSYKIVKRVAMDKCKLAIQAEDETPYQVIEATTPEQKAKRLAESRAAKRAVQAAHRAKELAGLI